MFFLNHLDAITKENTFSYNVTFDIQPLVSDIVICIKIFIVMHITLASVLFKATNVQCEPFNLLNNNNNSDF